MAYKKSFNNYKIVGDNTTIYLPRRNGEIFKTCIDTKYLQMLIDLDWCWHTSWNKHFHGYYVAHTEYLGIFYNTPKSKTHLLHKVIVGNKNVMIDHIDHNGLNNRMNNLRVIDNSNNLKNRKGINSNNTSGYRNVTWSTNENLWIIQMQINGKNTIMGKFIDLDRAGQTAKELRDIYYSQY